MASHITEPNAMGTNALPPLRFTELKLKTNHTKICPASTPRRTI